MITKEQFLEYFFNCEQQDGEDVYYVNQDFQITYNGEVVDCVEPAADAFYCNQDRESSWSWNKQVKMKDISVCYLTAMDLTSKATLKSYI